MNTDGFSEADLSRTSKAHQNGTQSRKVGMFMASSDLDTIQEHPHLGYGSNPAKTEKQARFMRACAHGAGYSSCPSKKVAREFMHTAILMGSLLLLYVACALPESPEEAARLQEEWGNAGRVIGGTAGHAAGGPAGEALGSEIGYWAGVGSAAILAAIGGFKAKSAIERRAVAKAAEQ